MPVSTTLKQILHKVQHTPDFDRMRNDRISLSQQLRGIPLRLCRIELAFLRFARIGLKHVSDMLVDDHI